MDRLHHHLDRADAECGVRPDNDVLDHRVPHMERWDVFG